jgi:putative peptide zinc metalloprotease protein
MSDETPIFSESWHRIAGLRIGLRAAVQVRRQDFRGERWFVLQDQFDSTFYRFRPAAYQFLARLRPDRSVQEVWEECLAHSPEQAPTQPEVIRLLSQLHQANLLQTELPPDSARLLERREKRESRQLRSTLSNILFLKLPLWDPDAFLRRCLGPLRWLVSRWMALVWCVVIAAGLKIAADHAWELDETSANLFAPDNLALLYAAFIVTKVVHEFGHAFLCRAFGGEVHRMGVMLMIFNPMPFVDASASWAFRSRTQRVLVAAGGMIFELFFAALAVFVWAKTGPGVVHHFAGNVMFIASVTTLLFNLNPLIRFDGYYILSDLLDVPNLASRAFKEVRYAFEKWVCGMRGAASVAGSAREQAWLIAYGLAAGVYRVVLGVGIVLYIGDRFFEIGLLLAVGVFIAWIVMPLGKFVAYLAGNPALQRHRARAWGWSGAAAAVLVAAIGVLPFPNNFRAPGVIEAERFAEIFAPADGFIETVVANTAAHTPADAQLVRMRNPELEISIRQVRAQRRELEARQAEALDRSPATVEPLRQRMAAIDERLRNLEQQQAALDVRAGLDGIWVAPHSEDWLGAWAERGTALGQIVNPEAFRFSAVVSQEEAASLFSEGIAQAEVRLAGQAGTAIPVTIQRIVPAQQNELPTAALGWRGGGDVAVSAEDPSGRMTAEPFFQVLAAMEPADGAMLLHHRSGQIRFELAPQPLLQQWWRKVLQLVQKRYRI